MPFGYDTLPQQSSNPCCGPRLHSAFTWIHNSAIMSRLQAFAEILYCKNNFVIVRHIHLIRYHQFMPTPTRLLQIKALMTTSLTYFRTIRHFSIYIQSRYAMNILYNARNTYECPLPCAQSNINTLQVKVHCITDIITS